MKKIVFIFYFILVVFYCEFGIYYIVLMQCNWPSDHTMSLEQPLKVMFIADTHLLGTRKGNWFDKMRREWEMKRAFQTAIRIHSPELVFVLGDLFDEGLWSSEKDFNSYVATFKNLFSVPKSIKLYTVVGNHDIGFHYSITPYLERRFYKAFNTGPVTLVSKRNVHFVTVNSMAMEMDGCYFCYNAEQQLRDITRRLKCSKREIACPEKMMVEGNYSAPILLQHFPLHRKNDMACNEPDSAPTNEKQKSFRDGWDCLKKDATKKLLQSINPRLVFDGHSHHGCHLIHQNNIHEYTLSSFNWRNKYNPSFVLAQFTANQYGVETCHMPREFTIATIYMLFILIFLYKNFNVKSNFKRFKRSATSYIPSKVNDKLLVK
ncbi:metallophosphoesterase 1 isoform X2 [Adelges cooleyi]|uniref:metallophosphoesterase 1 isoform X2 n=1 Tax=Adelges cooleyi TaxID=133065 RepID=UPI00217FC734|nr:metallophosphoesterase 1 isoform X2 [Adelges cooleyi]